MKKFLIVLGAVLFWTPLFAGPASQLGGPMEAKVQAIIREAKLKSANVGVYAVSFPKNKVLVDINKDVSLNPASCLKLITTAVALKTLGPDYQFPTRFYLSTSDQRLATSDLWVKGFGDPSLVIERLDEMVSHLIKAGLPVEIGDIFIDDSYFDRGGFPGRQRGSTRSYNAMTSAVALNHGSVTVEVLPGSKAGAPVQVVLDAGGVAVENKARTGPKRSKNTIRISRVYTGKGDTVRVTGHIPLQSAGRKQYFNVTNPTEHFGDALKTMLIERGINVAGKIRYGIVPKTARLILEEKSPPLSEIVGNMNKNSSNFMAEQVTKVIGAKAAGEPGTTEKGVQVFTKYLASLGNRDFYIENGSGLSYNNEVSPYVLFTVMEDMYTEKGLRDVYINSLSVAGEDGTLKKWGSPVLAGRLRAKTGALNNISSLAGFLPDDYGVILFVVFLNGERVDFWKGRTVAQKIAETLADYRQ